LDIVVLSSGEDGHIGALYPNHHSIKNNFPKFISMGDSPKPPQKRMTASRKMIEKADDGLLLFFGAGKTDAYFKYKLRTNSVEDCPAQICKSYKHGRALVNLF
jgi:6-phosphogluconolactonase